MKKKENHSRRTRERQTGGTALCLLRGMGIAFAITCIIFIGFGMILTYTTASEESLPLVSLICTALSVAAAGYSWAACKKREGTIRGSGRTCFTPLCFTLIQALRRIPSFCIFGADDACSGTTAGVISGILDKTAGSATELNKLANPSFYAKINFVINGIKSAGSFR